MSERPGDSELEQGPFARFRAPIGSVLLFSGAGLFFLATIWKAPGQFGVAAHAGWRSVAFLSSVISGFVGAWLLRTPPIERASWMPELPGRRFDSIVLYTRHDCPLCDEARDVLAAHDEYLPPLSEVDVDSDPALVNRYGTQVPVVAIDGRDRFRGRVELVLLRRMIEATPPSSD